MQLRWAGLARWQDQSGFRSRARRRPDQRQARSRRKGRGESVSCDYYCTSWEFVNGEFLVLPISSGGSCAAARGYASAIAEHPCGTAGERLLVGNHQGVRRVELLASGPQAHK